MIDEAKYVIFAKKNSLARVQFAVLSFLAISTRKIWELHGSPSGLNYQVRISCSFFLVVNLTGVYEMMMEFLG